MALGWRGQYFRYKEFFLNILELYRKKQDLRMFLEVILSLTTVTIFLLFALKPTATTIVNLLKEIDEKEETVDKLDEKIRNLSTAQDVYDQEVDSVPIIESSFPNSPAPDLFAGQVQGLANKNSVSVLGISVGETTLFGKSPSKKSSSVADLKPLPVPAKEMSVSLSVNGSFPNLISFVKDIENGRRPMKIDILGINSSVTENGQTITMIISGRIPFLGQ